MGSLRERLGAWAAVVELAGGAVQLRLRLNSLTEAERWVLSWGTHATVLRPKRLATRIREVAEGLAKRYRQKTRPR